MKEDLEFCAVESTCGFLIYFPGEFFSCIPNYEGDGVYFDCVKVAYHSFPIVFLTIYKGAYTELRYCDRRITEFLFILPVNLHG